MKTPDAAVIVLLEQATDSLILTKRSELLRNHPGEICFPGGRWEPGDADFLATALRELQEELSIEPSRVALVKQLEPESTRKGTLIQPWFASLPRLSPFVINTDEVVDIIRIPMKDVVLPSHYQEFAFVYHGKRVHSCQFTGASYFIWGATARIMRQFSE